MRSSTLTVILAALLTLSACSAPIEPTAPETVSATVPEPAVPQAPASPPVASATVAPARKPAPEPEQEGLVKILEVGVGQDQGYAWAAAVVRTSGYVGEFLTVHFNVFDDDGELIASGDQVEQIASERSTMALGTQVEVGDARAARVDATYAVSDYGWHAEAMPEIEPVPVTPGDSYISNIRLENTTDEPWENLRVGIVCRNGEGAIMGGGHSYPDLVPANGPSMVDAYLIRADEARDCTAYPSHSIS